MKFRNVLAVLFLCSLIVSVFGQSVLWTQSDPTAVKKVSASLMITNYGGYVSGTKLVYLTGIATNTSQNVSWVAFNSDSAGTGFTNLVEGAQYLMGFCPSIAGDDDIRAGITINPTAEQKNLGAITLPYPVVRAPILLNAGDQGAAILSSALVTLHAGDVVFIQSDGEAHGAGSLMSFFAERIK